MTDVLVERGGRDVALSVAQNSGAKFSETGYVRLVKRSEHDEELARSVGSRPEIPRHHFLKLLSTASKAVRIALEGAHPEHAGEIQQVVAKVATAIQAKAAATSRDYAAARERVETLRASGKLGEGDLARFAQAGSFEDTAVVLATLSALPIDVVERVLVQDRAETILIVAKVDGTVVADGEGAAAAAGRKGRPVHPGARAAYGELHAAQARDRAASDRVPAKAPGGGMTPRAAVRLLRA